MACVQLDKESYCFFSKMNVAETILIILPSRCRDGPSQRPLQLQSSNCLVDCTRPIWRGAACAIRDGLRSDARRIDLPLGRIQL